MVIDGHAHMGGAYRDLGSIFATLDRNHVDRVILVPSDKVRKGAMWIPHLAGRMGGKDINFLVNRLIRITDSREQEWQFIHRANEEVFNLASSSGGRVFQFLWADPLRQNIADEIRKKHAAWDFRGIKLHQCVNPFLVKSAQFYQIAEVAQELKLPVFIHLYSRKEIIDFMAISGNFETPFIMGHLVGFELYAEFRDTVSDNVYFDISCPPLVTARRIRLAIRAFGPGRVVMGSDTPYGRHNLEAVIATIHSLEIDDSDKERILGLNMKRILGI